MYFAGDISEYFTDYKIKYILITVPMSAPKMSEIDHLYLLTLNSIEKLFFSCLM